MLYQMHEMHAASVTPMRLWAQANLALYGNPFSVFSYNPVGRMIAASADLVLRTTHRYEKPPFELTETTVDGQTVSPKSHSAGYCAFAARQAAKRRGFCWWRRSPGITRRCCAIRCAR